MLYILCIYLPSLLFFTFVGSELIDSNTAYGAFCDSVKGPNNLSHTGFLKTGGYTASLELSMERPAVHTKFDDLCPREAN